MKKTQLARSKVNKETSRGSARSYRNWILDLRKLYKAMQCKAAIVANIERPLFAVTAPKMKKRKETK